MTQAELKQYFRDTLVAQRNINQEIDVLDAVVDFIAASTGDIPAWNSGLTFQQDGSDDGAYATHPDTNDKLRFWKTKTDDNTGNEPPTNPATTENTYWIEVSPSPGSGVKEWTAGIYGDGLIIVYHNHSVDGRGLYILTEPVRPFESTNIETEITASKWEIIAGGGGGGSGLAIAATYANIAALIAAQGAQEEDAWYMVTDASADATVDAGWAIYQYLGTTVGDLTDYLKVAEFESLDVVINDASETVKGIVELDNQPEAEAGGNATSSGSADHTRAMTARGVWWFWEARRLLALFYNWIWGFVDEAGTSHTFALSDAGKSIRCSSSSAVTITIPANATIAFAIGTRLRIKRTGTGSVTLAPAGGVTFQAPDPTNLVITKQYAYVDLVKTDTNTWEFVHTPSNFWEWAKTQIQIYTGTDDSSGTYMATWRNLSTNLILRLRNDQVVEVGGGSHYIEVGDTVPTGAANYIFNSNKALALAFKSKSSDNYLGFKSTTGDEAVVLYRVKEFDRGNGFVSKQDQSPIVTTNTSAAAATLVHSIPIPVDYSIEGHVRLASAKTSGAARKITSPPITFSASNIGGTTAGVADTPTQLRITATTGGFSITISNANDRIEIYFTNETGTGYAYECLCEVEYILRPI